MKTLITRFLNQVMLLEALQQVEQSSMNEPMRGRLTETAARSDP